MEPGDKWTDEPWIGAAPKRASVWLRVAFVAIIELLFILLDPLGLSTATREVSSRIADRVAAPFYGFKADEPDNQYVASSTRAVVVVLIDDRALATLKSSWPIPYETQISLFTRLLSFQPRAVFVDLLYAHDRGDLALMAEFVKAEAEAETTAAAKGIDPTGVLFAASAGPYARAHPAIAEAFTLADVSYDLQSLSYDIVGPDARAPDEDGEAPRTAAFELFRIGCALGPFPGDADLPPGCASVERVFDGSEARKLSIRWGNLTPDVWEPMGDLRQAVGMARFKEAARAERQKDGCRHFEPSREGRLEESFEQAVGSFSPLPPKRLSPSCAYTLTIPAEELLRDTPEMRAYLEAALKDKLVLVGSAVAAAYDVAPILGTWGPGVYRHAMALDNLLLFGADHYRTPPLLDPYLPDALKGIDLRADALLEIALLAVLAPLFFLIERYAGGWASRGLLRRITLDVCLLVIAAPIIGLALWGAAVWLHWPPYGWIGALLLAFAAGRIIAPAAREMSPAGI